MTPTPASIKDKLLRFFFGIEPKENQNTFKEIARVLLETLVIVLTIHTFLYKPFVIPTQSMVPTLLVGDYLFVSKFKYGYSNYSFPGSPNLFKGRIWGQAPQYGDVVVFRPPHKTDEDWVKRVVGLPGDRVQMMNGRLHINDQMLPLKFDRKYEWQDQNEQRFVSDLYIETLPNGRTHELIKTIPFGRAERDDTPVYTVPQDHYFMVGDDRDFSGDSRYMDIVGCIPYDNIVGQPQLVFFSTDLPTTGGAWWQIWKWPLATRYQRAFNLIR